VTAVMTATTTAVMTRNLRPTMISATYLLHQRQTTLMGPSSRLTDRST
jgi:hypothetical protein